MSWCSYFDLIYLCMYNDVRAHAIGATNIAEPPNVIWYVWLGLKFQGFQYCPLCQLWPEPSKMWPGTSIILKISMLPTLTKAFQNVDHVQPWDSKCSKSTHFADFDQSVPKCGQLDAQDYNSARVVNFDKSVPKCDPLSELSSSISICSPVDQGLSK